MTKFIKNILAVVGIVFIASTCITKHELRQQRIVDTLREQIIADSIAISDSIAIDAMTVELPKSHTDSIAELYIDLMPTEVTTSEYVQLMRIAEYAAKLDMQHLDIFVSQVILETGWLRSSLCTNNNNLTGMKLASSRPTTRLPNSNGSEYASYANIKASILDYYIWQIEYANSLSKQGYYDRLRGIYGLDSMYVEKVKTNIEYAKIIIESSELLRK